jgi:4-amino-4-deoxy-L-arabinose transferase-like glycosyltransferase
MTGPSELRRDSVSRAAGSLPWALPIALAAFNLLFRLNHEIITEWDESLYVISAAEAARNGTWLGTTFLGALDYYNTKPPLNVWMIALTFKAFGIGLVTARVPSALAALATVIVLMVWARRVFDARTAFFAGLVLSTTFGFFYVHSGKSANTDAPFTLLMLLTAVVLWAAYDRRWRLLWLGPILAAVFLLRGMAVLMPMAFVAPVILFGGRGVRRQLAPLAGGAVLFAAPVGAWSVARWRLDRWEFLGRMFHYDFVQRSAVALEGHEGAWYYYLNELQKNQYDWLLAAAVAVMLFPIARREAGSALLGPARGRFALVLALTWVTVTLLVPTVMQTKVAWYLNPFYPIFALLVARVLVHALSKAASTGARGRRGTVVGAVVLALLIAEARLLWYSYNMRDLSLTAQGLLLDGREHVAGRRVFRREWPRADRFVLEHVVGGQSAVARDVAEFLSTSRAEDYLLIDAGTSHPALEAVRATPRHALATRRQEAARGTPLTPSR